MSDAAVARPCPFCGGDASGATCARCGRDPTAARRVCASCKKLTPTKEAACVHCRAVATSDLSWKIPLIIGLFVAAIILSMVLSSL